MRNALVGIREMEKLIRRSSQELAYQLRGGGLAGEKNRGLGVFQRRDGGKKEAI